MGWARPSQFGISGPDANFGGAETSTTTQIRNQQPRTRTFSSQFTQHNNTRFLVTTSYSENIREALSLRYSQVHERNKRLKKEKAVKTFSSAFRRTLRSGGISIVAAASIQQKPVQQKQSASLLVRSAERRMHSKVVSEYTHVH